MAAPKNPGRETSFVAYSAKERKLRTWASLRGQGEARRWELAGVGEAFWKGPPTPSPVFVQVLNPKDLQRKNLQVLIIKDLTTV